MSADSDAPTSADTQATASDGRPSASSSSSGDVQGVVAPPETTLFDLASLPDPAWSAAHDADDDEGDNAAEAAVADAPIVADASPAVTEGVASQTPADAATGSADADADADADPTRAAVGVDLPASENTPASPRTIVTAGASEPETHPTAAADSSPVRPMRSFFRLVAAAWIALRRFWTELWIRPAPESSARPLLRLDSGWLYLLCGLALLSATVVLPPSDALRIETARRDAYRQHEKAMSARLTAYEDFKIAIQRQDPELVRRLALTNYRQVPEGATPIAMYPDGLNPSIDAWISATLPPPTPPVEPELKDSWLRRTATGPHRLWLIGGAFVLIAIGLVLTDHRPASSTTDGSGSDAA